MQSVPTTRNVPRAEMRSQEMQPIADLHFTSRDAETQEVHSTPSTSRYTRSGSITAHYYGDESVNLGTATTVNRQTSNQSLQTAVGNKHAHQSRRLPYWIWFLLAKSLGIKLSPDDKPIFGTFMHVLTLILALGFAITFTWHKVYDIVSEYTKETVLKGAVAILMTIYWCCLGVYANQLASKLFRNQKFIDSVRLHTKTILKISAAGIMVCLGITVVILHCIDTADTYQPAYCHRVRIHPLVCHIMYVMKVGCVCISLLWNLLVGIVLLSVCRTHTIGIRRFIRELEIDGKLYELRLRQHHPGQNVRGDSHLQHEALWDDPLEDQRDLWENITIEEILSDDSSDDQHVIPARVASISCPTSPVMVRSVRSISNREGAAGVSFSLPRNQGLDSDFHTLESLKNLQTRSRSEDRGNMRHQLRNPFNQREDPLDDTAVRDYFTSDEASASPVTDVLLLEENYYEKEEKPVINEAQMKQNDNVNVNNNAKKEASSEDNTDPEGHGGTSSTKKSKDENGDKQFTWKFLTVDDIYLSYWKISCRLRFTSIALQRWLIAFLMYIILWSFTYIVYWVNHQANLMDIALFIIPILIMPIVCSAYGEVNYEGKRMLRCICPTSERTEMLQTLFQQPLELNAFGFEISYQVIAGALGALALAFCTRLVLDEIGS